LQKTAEAGLKKQNKKKKKKKPKWAFGRYRARVREAKKRMQHARLRVILEMTPFAREERIKDVQPEKNT